MTKDVGLGEIATVVFGWWRRAGRVLPWRQKLTASMIISADTWLLRDQAFASYFAGHLQRDPYQVVVAELMLQQTQVDRVLPKYAAWMQRWPTLVSLAAAGLADVLVAWQGLGYNRRARFLWLLAKEIVETRGGDWPQTETELLTLPGIGKYTARAILTFAFGQQVAVVDTNIKRVLRRVQDGQEAVTPPLLAEKEWFARADAWLPAGQADPWNQALMDFGALVCTARAPKCPDCPLANHCQANQTAQAAGWADYRTYLQSQLPTQSRSPGQPRRVTVPFA